MSTKRKGGSRRLVLTLAIGATIVGAAIGWLCWKGGAPIPEIPARDLNPAAIDLIHRHREQVKSAPRSGEAWGKFGGVLKSFGFAEQAERCLAEAQQLDPKNPRWPYLLGTLQLAEQPPAALASFQRAVALCGNEPEMPRLRLAQLLAENGQQEQARSELLELLRAKPECSQAKMLLAHISDARGEYTNAIAMVTSCTTNPYTARAAWSLLAALRRREGDTNAAELASRRAAALKPDAPSPDPFEDEILAWRNDPRSLSDRAQNYLMSGRPSDALPLVNRLVQEHPGFAETWLVLGRAQYLQNQPVAAEQSFRRFLQLDPQSVNGHFQLGMSLLAQRRYEEAAERFRHATSLKRDFGPAFFNLGLALAKSGKPREAMPAFQEAIRQSPEMIDAYILLADLHLQFGERVEAEQLARLAERLNSADPRLRTLRGKLGHE